MKGLLLLGYLSVVVLFHFLQPVMKLLFNISFIALTQSFDSGLKFIHQVFQIFLSSLDLIFQVLHFDLHCIDLLLFVGYFPGMFLLKSAQFLPQPLYLVIESVGLSGTSGVELLDGFVLSLGLGEVLSLKLSTFFNQILNLFLV